jgi:hypothetical protein
VTTGRTASSGSADAGPALQKPVETERRLIEKKVTADLTETELESLLNALAKVPGRRASY